MNWLKTRIRNHDAIDAVSNESPEGNLAGLQIAEAVNNAVNKLPEELSTAVILRKWTV